MLYNNTFLYSSLATRGYNKYFHIYCQVKNAQFVLTECHPDMVHSAKMMIIMICLTFSFWVLKFVKYEKRSSLRLSYSKSIATKCLLNLKVSLTMDGSNLDLVL